MTSYPIFTLWTSIPIPDVIEVTGERWTVEQIFNKIKLSWLRQAVNNAKA